VPEIRQVVAFEQQPAVGLYGQPMDLEMETLETQGFESDNHGQTVGP
jgi:hypothetical protein